MDRLLQDALSIQKLVPWIESDQDVINFMRRIPLENNYLRNKLTLLHFFKEKDGSNIMEDNFNQGIEDDAREIVASFPDVPYKEIKTRLRAFGTMINRKEAVLRELLYENAELQKVLDELDHQMARKRTKRNSSDSNIKIKIRKVDGTLEVMVPTSRQERQQPLIVSSPTNTSTIHIEIQQPNNSVQGLTNQNHLGYKPYGYNNTSASESHCTTVSSRENDFHHMISALPTTQSTSLVNQIDKTLTNSSCSRQVNNNGLQSINDVISVSSSMRKILEEPDNSKAVNDNSLPVIKPTVNITSTIKPQTTEDARNLFRSGVTSTATSTIVSSQVNNLQSATSALPTFQPTMPVRRVWDPQLNPVSSTSNNGNCQNDDSYLVDTPTEKEKCKNNRILVFPPPRLDDSSDSDDLEFIEKNAKPYFLQTRSLPSPVNLSKSSSSDNSSMAQPSTSKTAIPIENGLVHKNAQQLEHISLDKPEANVVVNEQLVLKLIELFPQACPNYLRMLSFGKQWHALNDIIEVLISEPDHPKRPEKPPSPVKEIDPEEQYEVVKALLPDADPTYLRMHCESLEYDPIKLNMFVNQANETKDYPTMKEYLRKQQLSAQSKQYTYEFNVEKFVELFPEPEKTFNDPNRKTEMDKWSRHFVQQFFEQRFDRIHKRTIASVLHESSYKIMPTERTLKLMLETSQLMKSRRKYFPALDFPQNILVLQELAYLRHKDEIEHYIEEKKRQDEADRDFARNNGLMKTCECCYDDQIMPKDTFFCPKEHMFCRDCIKKSCEVALGEGKTDFKCLSECDEEFQLQCLQHALPPKMFSKLAQKKALAEIKAAGLEELETCPFCDFASIPNENDKIFRCLNPDCMKESCRKCKEPNHIPLNCDEVERDEEVKARTYVENKMTEALLRKCYKCGTSFFKEEGCNKMTCTCGASMCYVCKEPVKDYTHFNGIGGDKYDLCPLYSDTNELNQQNVLGAAATAKAEVDPSKLKVDPSTDVTKHYQQRKKKLPHEPHLDLIHNMQNMQQGFAVRLHQHQHQHYNRPQPQNRHHHHHHH